PVKAACHVLIGINTADKYKLFEDLSKLEFDKRRKSIVPKELQALLKGQKISASEDEFILRDETYNDYVGQLKQLLKSSDNPYTSVLGEQNLSNLEKMLVVDENPKLLDQKYFDKLKEKIEVLFPNESYDETLTFIIEKDGSISTTRIVTDLHAEISGWLWESLYKNLFYIPGKFQGQIVRTKVFVRITNL